MRKRSLLATFAVAAALVAGACGGSTGSTVTGATLLIGDYQDADSLNPFFYSTVMSSNIVGATHDGLLRLNEKLELEPWMAEEAPSKANGGIQVPGVDGDAATAVAYTIEIYDDPATGKRIHTTGRYNDELRRIDGTWKFTRRAYRTVFAD